MAGTAAIVGAGQIGFAAAQIFEQAGWAVRVYARNAPPWPLGNAGYVPYETGGALALEADVVIDTIAFDAADAARHDPSRIGRLIVISSASVYSDAQGRTLDEAADNGFPRFERPIAEGQTTVDPGPHTYSTRKVRMEQAAQTLFGDRATVLRPCAIHGPWSRHPREWWFVKRMLDGRRTIPLAHEGKSRFQTTAVRLLAQACERSASRSTGGVFNISDDHAPSVIEIGRAIADSLGALVDLVGCKSTPGDPIGRTPWSIPFPMEVSGDRAAALLELSPPPYACAVEPTVDWLSQNPPVDWRAAFPQLAVYPWDLFDYGSEDRFLASR